jgi:hypothetical protein
VVVFWHNIDPLGENKTDFRLKTTMESMGVSLEDQFENSIRPNGGIFDETGRKEARSLGGSRSQAPGGALRSRGRKTQA